MKRMKKILAVLLAAIMVMSLGTSVFADETASITIEGVATNNHTFSAYQIFDGDVSGATVSNVNWGTGINSENLLSAIEDLTEGDALYSYFGSVNCSTAADVAAVVATNSGNSTFVSAFAALVASNVGSGATGESTTPTGPESNGTYTYTISNLDDGYYLVLDSYTGTEENDDALSAYILRVLSGEENTINTKASVPTVTKYVSDGTNTAESSTSDDAVSASIGEELTFTLVGTMPSSDVLATYSAYKYIFHDTLSDGLTLDTSNIKVYVTNDISDLSIEVSSSNVKIETDSSGLEDDCTFEVSFEDILTAVANDADSTLVTKYTYIVVQYTASLNTDAVVGYNSGNNNSNTATVEYSNNPNTTATGKTTEELVNVYTYELDITKANGSDSSAGDYNVLSGAVFVLYDSNNNYAKISSDGTVTEWVTSSTYNAAEDKSGYQVTSDTYGKITISGLGEGTYYLKEITAPDGYNLLTNAVTIVISATESTTNVENLKATVTVDGSESNVSSTDRKTLAFTIVNTAGSTLPTTGGIGTTIFYVVGAILVLGAAVILITRRRMASR